jgi:hypothetical protein
MYMLHTFTERWRDKDSHENGQNCCLRPNGFHFFLGGGTLKQFRPAFPALQSQVSLTFKLSLGFIPTYIRTYTQTYIHTYIHSFAFKLRDGKTGIVSKKIHLLYLQLVNAKSFNLLNLATTTILSNGEKLCIPWRYYRPQILGYAM